MSSVLLKKLPSEDQKNPPSSRSPAGKAESMEEATVYVDDLDVFVRLMLREDFHRQYYLWVSLCEYMGYSCEWKESPSSRKDGKVVRCKSENHVPTVAGSEEPRILDFPAEASGDRLHSPGVQAPEDRSHKVPEWLQPFEGLPDAPPDSQHVVVEQLVVEPIEKTPDDMRVSCTMFLRIFPTAQKREETIFIRKIWRCQ